VFAHLQDINETFLVRCGLYKISWYRCLWSRINVKLAFCLAYQRYGFVHSAFQTKCSL